ncbi:DMT family transporter [Jatrophihabitans sp. YIM 134969]
MLALSLTLGVLSAVAYGCSTAVQHAAVHDESGRTDARGLLALLRNPRWLLSVGGDAIGLLLQVVALSTGPVVLIQPLQVLSLPVAMPIRARLGGPRPTARDWGAVVAVVLGLALFLLLVGDPGEPTRHRAGATLLVAAGGTGLAVVVALAALAAVPRVRAVVFGALGGMLFAVVAVLIDETSAVVGDDGVHALWHSRGLLLVVAVVVAGGLGMTLTQAAFQIGGLGAAYPTNVVVDPVLSVVLGAALLGERLPLDPLHVVGYLLALAVVATGTIGLANPRGAPTATPTRGLPT